MAGGETRRFVVCFLVFGATLAATRPARAVDYSAKGALTTSTTAPPGVGGTITYPTQMGTYPWVFVAHDQASQASDWTAFAQHVASHGLVAYVAELCSPAGSGCLPTTASVTSKIATAKSLMAAPLLPVKVDAEKFGLVGHGNGAYLVGDADAAATTRVLLDPGNSVAQPLLPSTVMSKQTAPVLSLFAPSNACNTMGTWEPFGVQTKATALAATVVAASHCDASPDWPGCAGACKTVASASVRAAKFRGLTTAWLLGVLRADVAAACAVSPDTAKLDATLSNVRSTFNLPCGAGGAGGAGGSAGKSGASGASGAAGKAAAGGSSGSAAKAGAAGVAGTAAAGGSAGFGASGTTGGAGAAPKAGSGGASIENPDDGRNQYFELGQLSHEGLGDAESAPACALSGREARGLAWLAPLGLALALRRRSRGRA